MDWNRSEDVDLILNVYTQRVEAFDELDWRSFSDKWTESTAKTRWLRLARTIKNSDRYTFSQLNDMLLEKYKSELMSIDHTLFDHFTELDEEAEERNAEEREKLTQKRLSDPLYAEVDDDASLIEDEDELEKLIEEREDSYKNADIEMKAAGVLDEKKSISRKSKTSTSKNKKSNPKQE
jgi:hypothetical protein